MRPKGNAKGGVKGGGQRGGQRESQRGGQIGSPQGEVKGGGQRGRRKRGPPSHTCYHVATQRKKTGKSKTFSQSGAMIQCPSK